jgi:hypothetical protein
MTDLNKLADSLENIAHMEYPSAHHDGNNLREAARILRAAGAADVQGLMDMLDAVADAQSEYQARPTPEKFKRYKSARAALESALRVALAPKAGFVMVPRDGVEQIADALADVLATFQHAEPEALKAAIRHSNKSAHAAYTLVYGLLFAAQPGAQESAK